MQILNIGLRPSLQISSTRSSCSIRQKQVLHSRRRYALAIKATSICPAEYTLVDWKDDFHERYVLERSLGQGSFGQVWLATERQTREKVAVKEMPKQRGRLSIEGTRAKVDREISVMKDLITCPITVQLKECHALSGSYRIVMEYCSGRDLKDQIQTYGPVSEEIAAYVAYEILQIIGQCHDNQIVHGDVKTANFILRSNDDNPFRSRNVTSLTPGWLKAIDFGCSQYMMDGCRISSRVGTPIFMAPEVFDRDYGYESDMWSLGVVLYQLISGKYPFWNSTQEALTSSFEDVMDTVHLKDPDFVSQPFDKISPVMVDFLRRLLEKNYTTRMTAKEALGHPFITHHLKLADESNDAVTIKNNNIVPALAGAFKTTPAQ